MSDVEVVEVVADVAYVAEARPVGVINIFRNAEWASKGR